MGESVPASKRGTARSSKAAEPLMTPGTLPAATGGIAVVSVAAVATGNAWRVTLRFKWGGSNVQRPIRAVAAASRTEALKLAWDMHRREHIIENNGWTWAESGNGH
jgi:hypothetical protein